jgi:hypothetical protein
MHRLADSTPFLNVNAIIKKGRRQQPKIQDRCDIFKFWGKGLNRIESSGHCITYLHGLTFKVALREELGVELARSVSPRVQLVTQTGNWGFTNGTRNPTI